MVSPIPAPRYNRPASNQGSVVPKSCLTSVDAQPNTSAPASAGDTLALRTEAFDLVMLELIGGREYKSGASPIATAPAYLKKIQRDGSTQQEDDITGYALSIERYPEVRLLVQRSAKAACQCFHSWLKATRCPLLRHMPP